MNSARSNNLSFKYQRFTPSGSKTENLSFCCQHSIPLFFLRINLCSAKYKNMSVTQKFLITAARLPDKVS